MRWQDNAGTEDGFRIERASGLAAPASCRSRSSATMSRAISTTGWRAIPRTRIASVPSTPGACPRIRTRQPRRPGASNELDPTRRRRRIPECGLRCPTRRYSPASVRVTRTRGAAFVRRFQTRVFGLALTIVRDRAEAEEVGPGRVRARVATRRCLRPPARGGRDVAAGDRPQRRHRPRPHAAVRPGRRRPDRAARGRRRSGAVARGAADRSRRRGTALGGDRKPPPGAAAGAAAGGVPRPDGTTSGRSTARRSARSRPGSEPRCSSSTACSRCAMPDDRRCEALQDAIVELALGIAPGDERVRVLEHTSRCPSCRWLPRDLAILGDEPLLLAPDTSRRRASSCACWSASDDRIGGADPPGRQCVADASPSSRWLPQRSRGPLGRPPESSPPRAMSGCSAVSCKPCSRAPTANTSRSAICATRAVAIRGSSSTTAGRRRGSSSGSIERCPPGDTSPRC